MLQELFVLPAPKVRSLAELDLQRRKVFMRVDFNVPLRDGGIADDSRVRAALPSIEHVLARAKLLVLASHLGRPQAGKHDPACSLEPVATRLAELLGQEVVLLRDYGTTDVASHAIQTGGKLVLLENLRFHAGEKQNEFCVCPIASGRLRYLRQRSLWHTASPARFGVWHACALSA